VSEDSNGKVGRGRPPLTTQFKPGQSGNPKGRPRGTRRTPPVNFVLNRMVTISENGISRQVTAADALLLKIISKGLDGDGVMAREALTALEARTRPNQPIIVRTFLICKYDDPGDVGRALRNLRAATLLDPYRKTARLTLEPWIVEAALARLADAQLTVVQQEIVFEAVRTPQKVQWPPWWSVKA
jgi:Family of unknown function (DUF5681)